ncbi:response regulator [Scytonema sp. UIC 10036]|nr:response regulator [Scytonema sp. UIC 10036]
MTREKFRYTLDKVQHPEQFPATALIIAPNPPIEATSPPLILLAEDNEANIATISSYLGARGYRLIVARNGREAVSLAKAQHPDLIIMDIQMPGMDGLEAMRLLRADGKFLHTPIVALTALAMPGDRENCISAGANEYLTKPVKLKLLVETIKHLI